MKSPHRTKRKFLVIKEKVVIKIHVERLYTVLIISSAPLVTKAWGWNTVRIQNNKRQYGSGLWGVLPPRMSSIFGLHPTLPQ
jgi:hypothetical protein